MGYDVGVIYGTAVTPDADRLLQEVLFFDQMRALDRLDRRATLSAMLNTIIDQVPYNFMVKPLPLRFRDAVISRQYADSLAEHDRAYVSCALAPMTIVDRVIEAFLSSEVDIPLVLATAPGGHDRDEPNGLSEHGEHQARVGVRNAAGAQIRYLNYVGLSAHVGLVRGARAVVFPPRYEGFALPVPKQ